MGHPIVWWEIPHRRTPEPGELSVALPGGGAAPADQVAFVRGELQRVAGALGALAGVPLDDGRLRAGLAAANRVRAVLARLRERVFRAPRCPLPALEELIAEMLVLHFCSDRDECLPVLQDLLDEVERRVAAGAGPLAADAARVLWVNPVADLEAMNLLEACGGRICGTNYLFSHALDPIPTDGDPLTALARSALADPMVGDAEERAARIVADAAAAEVEAVVISRIPGASHCALEGQVIAEAVTRALDLPVLELEVPPVCETLRAALRTRLEALVETVQRQRRTRHALRRN